VLAPGLRIGYVIAPQPLAHKLAQAKQAADLHTSSFNQRLAYEVVKTGILDTHLPVIRSLYASQCRAMLDALAARMPDGTVWNRPEGGMFIWVRLPAGIDSTELLRKSLAPASGPPVAFVPGAPFYAGTAEHNTLRLSFVTVPQARIEEGVLQLSRVIEQYLHDKPYD
jgi:2-aminoadipate transaminase